MTQPPDDNRVEIAECEAAPVEEAEREPCPTPLAWQEVLTGFRSDAEYWEFRQAKVTLRGRTWGEGPPLYLIPALGGTHELYALLVWLLREDFRCITYDDYQFERGCRLNPTVLADNLFAIADQQGDRQFQVFAPAFGSVTAFSAMIAKPDRILGAALQGGFAHRKLSLTEKLLASLGRHLKFRAASTPYRQTLQTQNHLPWFPPIDQGRWSFFVDNTGQLPISALAERARVMSDFDVRDRLGEVSQPVLLIRTEGEGKLAANCQDFLADRIPETQTERMHSSGQLPYLTHPHRLAKLLKSFFSKNQSTID